MDIQLFSEKFNFIKCKKELEILFEDVKVNSVVMRQNVCNIYIDSDHIIKKTAVWEMEKLIQQAMFPQKQGDVRIREKYHLSDAYTLERIFEEYRDSLLAEFSKSNPIFYQMLKGARATYPEANIINLSLPDNRVMQDTEDDFTDKLYGIFRKRFCMENTVIKVDYYEKPVSQRRLDNEYRLEMITADIAKKAGISVHLPEGMETASFGRENNQISDAIATVEGHRTDSNMVTGDIKDDVTSSAEESTGTTTSEASKIKDSKENLSKTGVKAKGNDKEKKAWDGKRPVKRSDDPDVIYGRDITDDIIPISDIQGDIGDVVVAGQVIEYDTREIRNERTIISFAVTDFTDTISVKIFAKNENLPELKDICKGAFLKVQGMAAMDDYEKEITISRVAGIKKIPSFITERKDTFPRKRVELHCHTKMSDMDGVSDAGKIVKRAYKWGHPAIAITDHGVAQAFPEAFHTWQDLWGAEKKKRQAEGDENPNRQDFFKIIYGCEIYLVDDEINVISFSKSSKINGSTIDNTRYISLDGDFVVFDIETTGISPKNCRIIEIGAVKVHNGEIVDRFSEFVNPEMPIPYEIVKLTSIRDDMVKECETIESVLPRFLDFCKGHVLVAHNARFDTSFIRQKAQEQGLEYDFTHIDTMGLSHMLNGNHRKHTLDAICKEMKIPFEGHHRAVNDAEVTVKVFERFIKVLKEKGCNTLEDVNAMASVSKEKIRNAHSHHCIVLAKNNTGRINLYTLISMSHLDYFKGRPKIPKSMVNKYREGLIIGSACEAGELYSALLEDAADDEIARIVAFYDYLEIQPVGNNRFMIDSPKISKVNSEDDIRTINKQIVELGLQWDKPVVATCDVHFLDPEDEVYRRIIMAGKGFPDADNQAPLYLHTTEEMLEEFSYLGADTAEEVVITNTVKIADSIESIDPVRPDKCPPVIENSDKMLREICYTKAHEMYGENLPEIVEARLERELTSIIGNGFAVMYIIAQKLVWKSVEDGYLVGSRGSVGSSFVATMSGITEVNPLKPHYYCKKCHYSEFDSEDVNKYAGGAGVDMPDKACPVCGEMLTKDGFDIPFETFLGFKGNKEPDIDLNFSGEYQSKAHKYTEVIFGYGQTFRAGTVGTLADKTAYGYVKNYYEERGFHKRAAEINRITQGCTGVRRSTGQHPGGIIVLPVGENIYSFTPIQHPANDMETDTITTHFDYHSIDHNLLKLDILGHDDPTMMRMLQDLTGVDPVTFPLDDKKVMSIFHNTEALGITPEDIDGCKLGCLGIPEFGTAFTIQMLLDTKPTGFSDLIRIAGLSHGTDVWLGNAQTLIQEGKATISTAICTRDDIMTYLIGMGLESEESFKIMEDVRKGKVAKGKSKDWPAWKQDMIDHNVPDWYVWSCEKIQYMFPKAHAAAYVMMAWRVAYCKVYYPLAYYTAYFSIRASGFSYEIMCQGRDHAEEVLKELKKKNADKTISKKEEDVLKDLKIVQEMYARGFDFMPIDLFRAHSRNFQIIDGKIMPSFNSIDGLGDTVADSIMEASKLGPYVSQDDFRERAKVPKTTVEKMAALGLLGDLPESNQFSLADFFEMG